MKRLLHVFIAGLCSLAAQADGWGNYSLEYSATTDLTVAETARFLNQVNNMLGISNTNVFDGPAKVYGRVDTAGRVIDATCQFLLKDFVIFNNNNPVVLKLPVRAGSITTVEDSIDTGWAINKDYAAQHGITVEYDNVMAVIDTIATTGVGFVGVPLPVTIRTYVNTDPEEHLDLTFNLTFNKIEWGEWTSFGTAEALAAETKSLETFLSQLVLAIETPSNKPGALLPSVLCSSTTVDQRVSTSNPNWVQFRLNNIFNGVSIVLDYDVDAGTISAERQTTGYAIYYPNKPPKAWGNLYDEVHFELPETAYDPTSGKFDFTNAKFIISNIKDTNGLFNLYYTEESAINEIEAADSNGPVEYYNLRGQRIERPENGFYIERRNGRVTKRF